MENGTPPFLCVFIVVSDGGWWEERSNELIFDRIDTDLAMEEILEVFRMTC